VIKYYQEAVVNHNYPSHNNSGPPTGPSRSSVSVFPPSKLQDLAREARSIIFETKTVFPFDLFPNTLTICPNRITITDHGFLYSDEYPLPIEVITGARLYKTLLFASLTIETFGYRKPPPLKYLRVDHARLARRYILALIECYRQNIDLSHYHPTELRLLLKEIGMVREGQLKGHQL
jgi:hypothetical protein